MTKIELNSTLNWLYYTKLPTHKRSNLGVDFINLFKNFIFKLFQCCWAILDQLHLCTRFGISEGRRFWHTQMLDSPRIKIKLSSIYLTTAWQYMLLLCTELRYWGSIAMNSSLADKTRVQHKHVFIFIKTYNNYLLWHPSLYSKTPKYIILLG